jgi:AAA15 family ATPase/GTPase
MKIKKQIEKDVLNKKTKRISIGDSKGGLYTIYKDYNNELKVQKLGLIHSEEVDEIFELSDESDGTRRLFDLIPLIRMFSKDFTIVIDEFDRSLHPNLTKKFFELFYNLNKNKTQLIVSTHESTLLDLQLVRRDEME